MMSGDVRVAQLEPGERENSVEQYVISRAGR